jgi:hypothetical protein
MDPLKLQLIHIWGASHDVHQRYQEKRKEVIDHHGYYHWIVTIWEN